MSTSPPTEQAEQAEHTEPAELRPENIRAIRLGHGANCSSVGSVIDTLFLGAALGGAVFAAICAAMREEPIRVVGEQVVHDVERDGATGANTDEESTP